MYQRWDFQVRAHWKGITSMKQARAKAATFSSPTLMIVAGGIDESGNALDHVEMLDASGSPVWKELMSLPAKSQG